VSSAPDLIWSVHLDDAGLTDAVQGLRSRLAAVGWTDAGDLCQHPQAGAAVLVWADRPLGEGVIDLLLAAGRPVLLGGDTATLGDPKGRLAEAAGLQFGPPTPVHDLRIRTGPDGAPLACRLDDHAHSGGAHLGLHTHLTDRVLPVQRVEPGVQQLLTARLGLTDQPVAAWRPSTGFLLWGLGSRADALPADPTVRLLVLALRHALGVPAADPVRVGLLGYGAIGHEHNRAVQRVDGLVLTTVCDSSPARFEAARRYAPQARCLTDANELLHADDVDLVLVSTPPDSHARWAMAAIEAGKHVIVEKPFAITTAECDAVLAAAAERDRLVAVYQNRRYDPDHLAIRRALRQGLLGDLFHLESFVGGYGHPCNLWHSDATVSGGAVYDWGAHVLDQLLDLMPGPVEQVTAAEQKRVWFDVSNADHSRVTIRFTDGAEASFVYSDLAAALKPRWYLLGTRGALVGHWRQERVIARNDVGTLAEDVLSPADSPPRLELHAPDGSTTRLATPEAGAHPFHRELADRLLLGLPMSVTAAQSRRVLSVMEAAAASAAEGGRAVTPR
jgi:scyllo-inositol 2-dehydrogenase (NADP+)